MNAAEADRVRETFRLYLELGSLMPVVQELDRRGWRMKRWTTRGGHERGGAAFSKSTLHNLLTNAIYTGHVKFEGKLYDGEHERIIDDETFNRVQDQLNRNGRRGGRSVRNKGGALLKGLVRCGCGAAMTHTYVQKKQTRYRYYVCINGAPAGLEQVRDEIGIRAGARRRGDRKPSPVRATTRDALGRAPPT